MNGTAYVRYGNWRQVVLALPLLICGFLVASSASAQQASGIAGQVRDSQGLALPGVTVEASSPALIEKSRTVTTDGEGRYPPEDARGLPAGVKLPGAGSLLVGEKGTMLLPHVGAARLGASLHREAAPHLR